MERIKKTEGALKEPGADQPKYRLIFECLKEGILFGEYRQGGRLPSENDLVRRFEVSRMTIVKALKELQQLGLVERRVGSGTYVKVQAQPGRIFGLLIPELGQTEIFEPICRGIAAFPLASSYSLLWGNSVGVNQSKEQIAEQLCQQFIAQKVTGVFFAPLELSPGMEEVNGKIVAALDRANIPIVLLDRDFLPYPYRSKHDLVSIDNRRTAYTAVEHLITTGALRIAFLSKSLSAVTIDARIAGYQEALIAHGHSLNENLAFRCDPSDEKQIRLIVGRRPDAILCANDLTAANLMQTLIKIGVGIPEEIRLVGIDDVLYANLLPIPLTTMRQPCFDIGRIAMSTMFDRLQFSDFPSRHISLLCQLVVRKSCGFRAES
jgi:DNA-binding LacI/PurR family transcriptional regulator